MKKTIKVFLLFAFIGVMFSGCSNHAIADKAINPNQSESQQNISSAASDKEMLLTLNNLQFDLNKQFDEIALDKLSSSELSILRNSIYAKYGYIFSSRKYSDYFSQFSWYKPVSKDVKSNLNSIDTENIKRITSLEKKSEMNIKSSEDKTKNNNGNNGNIIFKFDNKDETLYTSWEHFEPSDGTNNPLKITLKLLDSEEVFESEWNDGVYVFVEDFDETDKYMDICIIETGTDIVCRTYIYRFDGNKLYYYNKFEHYGQRIKYDGKGKIYFWYDSDDTVAYNTYLDYKSMQSGIITDESLKEKLNETR